MLENLLKDAEIQRVMDSVAAGQAANTSSEVDMAGFDAVMFICLIGAVTATGTVTMKIQQDTATGMASAADLEGTAIAADSDDDDLLLVTDLIRPQERFVRAVVTTATANGEIDGVIAIKYRAKNRPTTQGATVVDSELHLSPAEGTA